MNAAALVNVSQRTVGASGPAARPAGPLLPIVLVLVVVCLTACTAPATGRPTDPTISSSSTTDPTPTPASEPSPKPALKPGEKVTKEKLEQLDPAAFYWDLLRRQSTAPATVITGAEFRNSKEFKDRQGLVVTQVGLDHRTGSDASTKMWTGIYHLTGSMYGQARCIDGKFYWSSRARGGTESKPKWGDAPAPGSSCKLEEGTWTVSTSDGIVPSGLNETQATALLDALRGYPGLVKPHRPTLITSKGQTYLRQRVDFVAIKFTGLSRPAGNYWLKLAFEETGLDRTTWPFATNSSSFAGLQVTYYYDPETLLPAASLIQFTPDLAEDGSKLEDNPEIEVFNYSFPRKLPTVGLDNARPPRLELPEGWKLPK